MRKAALFNNTEGKGHQGSDLVVQQIRRHLNVRDVEVTHSFPVGQDWRTRRDEVRKIEVDFIIVNGEGTIHRPRSRPQAVSLSSLGVFSRQELQVPSFMINATFYALDSEVVQDLSAFTHVYVRDSQSKIELERFGLTGASVVPDLTLSVQPPPAVPRTSAIGVTDSVLPEATRRLSAIARRQGSPFQAMQSKTILEKIAHKLKAKHWLSQKKRAPDILAFSANKTGIITGRYHAVALCLLTRTPFIAVESNTPKIEWLLNDCFGSSNRLVECADLESLDRLTVPDWEPEEITQIDTFLQTARTGAEQMFDAITARRSSPPRISV